MSKTTQQLYLEYKKGTITKEKMLYEIRRDVNYSQWLTPSTSFKDSIQILKNKGIIHENTFIGEGEMYDEADKILEKLSGGSDITEEDIKIFIDGAYNDFSDEEKDRLCKVCLNRIEQGLDDVLNEDHLTDRDDIIRFIIKYHPKYSQKYADITPLYDMDDQKLRTIYKVLESELGMSHDNEKEDLLHIPDYRLNENKKEKTADDVNYYEYQKGIKYEYDACGDLEKAMKKSLANVLKDPNYYTYLMNGLKAPKKRTDQMVYVDKKMSNTTDKGNAMQTADKTKVKSNVKDTMGNKEKGTKTPKGVKVMTIIPKKSKGVKIMDMPGKEKKITLKEWFGIGESKEVLDSKYRSKIIDKILKISKTKTKDELASMESKDLWVLYKKLGLAYNPKPNKLDEEDVLGVTNISNKDPLKQKKIDQLKKANQSYQVNEDEL